MNFAQTGLPERQIYRDAFTAGWEKYLARHDGDAAKAARDYLQGPVAMARVIYEHGGDFRQTAVAACLAGPAIFTECPSGRLGKKLIDFGREVLHADNTAGRGLSADARLFLQVSAIMLMEQFAKAADKISGEKAYIEALELYSAARGAVDTYRLDTRFEIAAMKATTSMPARGHIWARPPAMAV